jgi:hypothetical protein
MICHVIDDIMYVGYYLISAWSHMLVMASRRCTFCYHVRLAPVALSRIAVLVVGCAAAGCKCARWTWLASRWSTSCLAVNRILRCNVMYEVWRRSAWCMSDRGLVVGTIRLRLAHIVVLSFVGGPLLYRSVGELPG